MEATSSPSTLNPLAEPFKSTRPATATAPTTNPTNELIFHNLSKYPFDQDAEFQSGLSSILGHPATRASAAEAAQNADLVLQAQCFYFARQNNLSSAIDAASYKSWLRLRDSQGSIADLASALYNPSERPQPQPSPGPPPPPPPPPTQSTTPLPSDPPPPTPPYPTTFNHIVDLITRNQPIPGIETIPDIVLGTASSTPNTVPARRKPWETAQVSLTDPHEAPLNEQLDPPPRPNGSSSIEGRGETEAVSAKPKPLYGGLLGPLKRTEETEQGGSSSDTVKPIPVQTTTPSWQELAEEGAGAVGQVAQDGDDTAPAPIPHTA